MHNQIVRGLETELLAAGTHQSIETFWVYSKNGYCGEVDLLGKDEREFTFYEVKCHLTTKSRNTAQNQFERFKKAFPKYSVTGYLYANGEFIKL